MRAQNDTIAAANLARSSRRAEPVPGQSQVPPRPQRPVPRAPEVQPAAVSPVLQTAARSNPRINKRRATKSTIRLSASRFAYVCTWTILGVFSAAYVVGALLAPHEIDRVATALLGANAPIAVAEKPAIDPAVIARFETGNRELTAQVAELQSNFDGLSKGIAQLQQSNGVVFTHLKAIETGHPLSPEEISAEEKRLGSQGAVFHPEATADGTVDGVVMDGASIERHTIEPQVALPAGKAAAKTMKPKSVSQIASAEDGADSLDQIVADAPVLPAKKQFGIELSEAPDTESLRGTWDALHVIQPKLFDGLTPLYAGGEGSDGQFRLLGGPVSSARKADDLCKKFAAQNLSCKVTAYSGNPL